MNANKRLYKLFLLVILLTIYLVVFVFFLTIRGSYRFNSLYIDESYYNELINTRIPIEEDILATIQINNRDLFKTSNTNELFYSMVSKEKNRYNPFLKVYANIDDFNVALFGNTITDELIKNNEHIKLIVYNDTQYKEYEIVVTTLPIMNISYEDNEDNNEKINKKGEDVYGKFYLYDNEKNQETSTKLKFHVRGGTSTFFPKKGFKLSLKGEDGYSIDSELLGMREDDDWILYAGYTDQEMVRNVFSSKIWYDCFADDNEFGIKAGMYYEYVELFFNGKYWGLYALGFPIDTKQLQIQPGENLYKKEVWSSDNVIYEDGNHIENSVYNIKSDTIVHYELEKYITQFNTVTEKEDILNLIDIDNNIDFYLFSLLSQNDDAVFENRSKNLYVAFKRNSDNVSKAVYIPWDLDYTFGNVNSDSDLTNYTQFYGVDFKYMMNYHSDSPIGRVNEMDADYVKNLVKQKWKMVRSKMNDDYINKLIQEYESSIYNSGSYDRDMQKWPFSSKQKEYNLNEFKKYIFNRINYFDEYINNIDEEEVK